MRAIRRINNNVAVCVDGDGNELLAMGKGIGFGKLPRELSLAEVERTFYDVDSRYLAAVNDLPADVLDFSAKMSDYIRAELDYQLSPNLTFTLADHLAFAIKRAEQNLRVRMPISYDVEQQYPSEYRIGRHIMRRIRSRFNVGLSNDEAAAIALNLVNARVEPISTEEAARQLADDEMLEDVTEIIEDFFGVTLNRDGFAYSRYATHMHYLFGRLHGGDPLDSGATVGFQGLDEQYPEAKTCVENIATHIEGVWRGAELTEDEKLYLLIHVSRLCMKGSQSQ